MSWAIAAILFVDFRSAIAVALFGEIHHYSAALRAAASGS
jgi:hypothetical protein